MSHWVTRVARGTAFSIVAEILARAANPIFFVLLTWYIGRAEAGNYNIGFLFSTILLPFALGGIDQLLIRESARDHSLAPRLLGNMLFARIVAVSVCYLLLLAWLAVDKGYSPRTDVIIAILAAISLPECLVNLYQGYLFTFDRVIYTTLISAITGGIKLALGLVALALGGKAIVAAIIVLVTELISLLLHAYFVARNIGPPSWRIEWSLWRSYGQDAFTFFLIALFLTLEGVQDALILSRLYGPAVVAIYSAAGNVITLLSLLPQGFRQAILPVLTSIYHQEREWVITVVAQSLRLLLTVTLLISLSLSLAVDWLLLFIYRGAYDTAAPVLVIMLWTFVISCASIPNVRLMIVAGYQRVFVPIQCITILLNLSLNLWLQPWIDVRGAAVARLASTMVTFLFAVIYVQRYIQRWPISGVVIRPLAAAAVALILSISARAMGMPLLMQLAICWLIYGGALWGLKAITIDDVCWLGRMVPKTSKAGQQ